MTTTLDRPPVQEPRRRRDRTHFLYIAVIVAVLAGIAVGLIAPEVGKQKNISNEKARRILGWIPRSNEESIVATAESLQGFGLLAH